MMRKQAEPRRAALLAAVMLGGAFAGAAPEARAGDPSGVDPAVLETCIAAAGARQGAVADCAGTAVAACKTFWAGRKPDMDPVSVLQGCTDAEQQLWDARLDAAYKALIASAKAGTRPEDKVEPVRAMERAWIAFRDARCAAERGLFGHGTGGVMAEPECRLNETARQTALLMALGRGE